jgi:hypothetical protein
VCAENLIRLDLWQNHLTSTAMVVFLLFLLNLLGLPFKSKSQLAVETLRQQVIVLQRKVRGRIQLTDSDRRFFIQLYR